MSKHAYLIMAHHRMDLLEELLKQLDDVDNDIFVHIDSKCKEKLNIKLKYSKLNILRSKDVRWAGYTQIECELYLLENAINTGEYRYYHLLTGVSFPIKKNSYIKKFFDENDGKEFVGFDNQKDYSNRVKYIYLFNEMGKPNSKIKLYKEKIRNLFVKIQKIIRIDKSKKFKLQIKKGIAYWSITDNFAKYIIDNKNLIKKIFKSSICGDEVFVQTILYNSPYRNNIYNLENEFEGSLVDMPWHTSIGEREGHNFSINDLDYLKKSTQLYALKFESEDGIDIIKKIKKEVLKDED